MGEQPMMVRLAKRLCALDGRPPDDQKIRDYELGIAGAIMTVKAPNWNDYIVQASEVLREIHTPTSSMLDAGSSLKCLPKDKSGKYRGGSLTVWRTMVEQAINDGTGGCK